MTYKAHVKNGAIVLDEPADLPEGMQIQVSILLSASAPPDSIAREIPTLYEQFEDFIGVVDGLPDDFALNHDHYLHGTPKR